MVTSTNGRHHDEQGREYALVDGERLYTDRMRGYAPRPIPSAFGPAVDDEPAPTVELFEVFDTPEILAFDVPQTVTLPVLGRDGLILEGGTNLLYSYPKTGKTELLTALAHDWVQGRRVLYLSEEPIPNWKRRLVTHGFTPADYTLRVAHTWGFNVDRAVRLIESESFDILVVDTLRNTVGFLEGDGDKDVARVMIPLFRAAAGHTVICSYHARKMPGEGGRDISGHHSLYGAFDRAIQLTPVEGKDTHRRLIASGRCMYEGDVSIEYRQVAPCQFEVLDGLSLTGPRPSRSQDLLCLGCGETFTSSRSDAQFCSDACRKRVKRQTTSGLAAHSDIVCVRDRPLSLGSADDPGQDSESFVDAPWDLGLTE